MAVGDQGGSWSFKPLTRWVAGQVKIQYEDFRKE